MNNDFLVTREVICQWFRHSWKSLANYLTRDQKIIIHSNSCIILYIHSYSNYNSYTMGMGEQFHTWHGMCIPIHAGIK